MHTVFGFIPQVGTNGFKCIVCGDTFSETRARNHVLFCAGMAATRQKWWDDQKRALRELRSMCSGDSVVDKTEMDAVYARVWATPPWVDVIQFEDDGT